MVTCEIKLNNAKNIIISCCYRTPGGSLQEFNDEINIFLEHYKTNKSYILCGDFNINTINYETHKHTKEFADTLLNAGLLPMISLPTRISPSNSTLIDNIYTNILYSSTNGVLIDDTISDHLPIFSCIDYTGLDKYNGKVFKYIRHSTPMAIEKLKAELNDVDWNCIYTCSDCNESTSKFINKIKDIYDKHFPVKKVNVNSRRHLKPWMTKGLITSCNKKNRLYKNFIRLKTPHSEEKYKRYKNKLTTLLRFCEKQYYSDLLQQYSNNIKKTWGVLNDVI